MKIILIFLYCGLFGLMLSSHASEKDKEQENTPVEVKSGKPKAISTGDKIYTWIDDKGNRIYSDEPREGAEVMKIPLGTDYTPQTSAPDWDNMKPKVIPAEQEYSHFEIVSPANDATVRNNNGTIQVALDIRPKLTPGHKVKLEINGQAAEGTGSSIITLTNIDRGSHTLIAYILTADEEIIATTKPVVIHMHRAIKKATTN